jgi:ABC-2 type transport system permease protein/capsular polysaccharide transport system permease protein
MHSSSLPPETGALVRHSPWSIHRRVIGALLVREMLTRYGRNNIGFLWLFVEPAIFVLLVTLVWSAIRNIHVSDLPIVAFAVTGYTSLLLWRNAVSRCIGAVKANKALLFHRQVTILDIFTARVLLELMAVSTALVGLSVALYAFGWLEPPEDALQVVGGWLLLAWFAAGFGLTVGGLSEKAEVVGRFWHPFSYLLMAVSGVAYIVDALPPTRREIALWVPMVNAVEYIREGWFGSLMHAHYDLAYLSAVNVGLTLVGLTLVRQIGFDSSDE